MIGNFVSNLKSRLSLTNRIGDHSMVEATDNIGNKSRNLFVKLLNSSYSLVNQSNYEDTYCNDNSFMLPRVYGHQKSPDNNCNGLWSPVALAPKEKSRDELDNVVDKFIRCISVESDRENYHVHGKIYYNTSNNFVN